MAFLQRWLYKFMMWMRGRNGTDQLAIFSFIASVILQLLASILGSGTLLLVSLGLYGWTLFRVFSKKSVKRAEENRKFVSGLGTLKTKARQMIARIRNMRQYKYFKCPQCKALLRLTRGQGEKEVCCPQCQHRFRMKS